MDKIALVTDSTAYLSEEEIAQHAITVIPLTVNFADGFIYDGLVDTNEFFARVDRSNKLPFTSQPAVGQFVEIYRALIEAGKEVISIHLSSELSGTFESARGAASMVDPNKITVIDSTTTSAPMAFLVLAASQWAREGFSRSEIAVKLEKAIPELRSFFIPDTLEYLKKGGRIGGAQALLGSMLQIKPILYFFEGKVEVFEKVRTRRKAINRMLQELPLESKHLKVAVVHCAALEDAVGIKELIIGMAPHAQVEIREFGPVLSTHGGPGLVGMGVWAHD
ncbi:MAG: DegV family protein [Dethiobacteria bacterium]|jgi:DegV family protein with EDD domain|nr:DegV family protein [Bacillota bacterium]HOB29644.1 DegV family protein [Bacillota bacterium]